MKTIRFFAMVGLITSLLSACGYHLEGGGYINEDVTRVAVEVFENKSSQTRAGISFTNEIIQEIMQKTDTKVVDSSRATRKIIGTIKSIGFSTLSRSSTETVVERRVTARVDVQLVGPDGEILWSVKDFSTNESYTVAEDKIDDESNIRTAVDEIARRCAERIVSQMLVNF